mgnify:CR=1 FL=1
MQIINLLNEGLKVVWFADSKTIVSWDGQLLQLWNLEGQEVERYRFRKLNMIKENPRNKFIVVGGNILKDVTRGY